MTSFRLLPTAALAALALFATTAASGQGLGGLLDKANRVGDQATRLKQTVKQNLPASTSPGNGKPSPAESQSKERPAADGQSKTSPADGQTKGAEENPMDGARREPLDSPPSPLTAQNQVTYIRAQMADNRPVVVNRADNSPSYNYRRLTQLAKVPVKFTWDDAALKVATARDEPLWNYINTMSYDIVSRLDMEQGPYLKSALPRVKEIHLTREQNNYVFTRLGYAFNPSTGVLTAALNMNEEGSGPSSEADVAQWIIHNMTKAGKSAIELENEAGFRNAREHPSSISTAPSSGGSRNGGSGSSAKSWTCTWCHESVTAASRPSLAGCPRNSAHQHAWHN